MALELEVVKTSGKPIGKISIASSATIKDLKKEIFKKYKLGVERQSIRNGPKGKDEKDSQEINKINLETPNTVYVKDLGPQIGWDTVFFLEYAGPIFLYGALFLFPHCFYGGKSLEQGRGHNARDIFPFYIFPVEQINKICGGSLIKVHDNAYYAGILWTIHYGKRILETAFVHRFSHGTMPIFNLFKNCSYYWGFAIYLAYHVNHPLHTAPPTWLFYLGVFIFLFCEVGNLSIHILLRNLRPEGSTVRKIPVPDSNPFTKLFNYVSCPNYTYEFGSWVGFTLLTGCFPVFIFALAGLYQMTVWAIGKHKKYRQEFPNYPKKRKAILPFLI
ncbi:probable very-long-chain enoyl-CoA reductase art-1 [Tribolium madens]|uniref:probable very-long-chain enoyl-CoA reductase art-1 n=1 Tax=Tribolium madens TaxID=41895 RepID=UPI001CF753DD|nr:probable very-long-chain enoyl-CoA reductase art-1 [Tribolium madens]